jgi:hypothetical protein
LKAATGFTRQQLMADDVHPSTLGNKVYAAHIAFGTTCMLQPELLALAAGQHSSTLQQQQPQQLPPPMSPCAAMQGDSLPFCAEGELLRKYLVDSGNLLGARSAFNAHALVAGFWAAAALNGTRIASLPDFGSSSSSSSKSNSSSTRSGTPWAWNDAPFHKVLGNPNGQNLGLQGRGLGSHVELKINTQTPPGAATAPPLFQGSSSSSSSSDAHRQQLRQFQRTQKQLLQQLPQRRLVVLFNRGLSDPGSRMGVAQLTCVSGCKCEPMWLVGYKKGDTAAALRENSTQVRTGL